MRAIAYSVIGLFVLGMALGAQPVYSDIWYSDDWYEAPIGLYAQPAPMGWDTFAASQILWSQLRNSEGDPIAEICDLVIDPANGRVTHVVLSGIKGMGAEQVFVPFDTLSRSGSSIFVYNAPEDVYRFYGYGESPYWTEGFDRYAHQSLPMGSYRNSTLIGTHVETRKMETLGRIDDFVIDSKEGHVVYFILFDAGGTEGRLAAVPFNALTRSGEAFTLDMTREQLLADRGFRWEDMSDRSYAEGVYRHYGLRPYWEYPSE